MKNLLILIFLLSSIQIFSQEDTKIKVYTPEANSSKKSHRSTNNYLWALKLDLFTSAVSGEIPLSFEHRITPKFSLEGSLGLTYGEGIFKKFKNEFDESYDDFEPNPALGTAYRGNIKFYPSNGDDAIEGWNFGIAFFQRNLIKKYDEAYNFSKDLKRTYNGVQLTLGSQLFIENNICYELIFGFGLAQLNEQKYYYYNQAAYYQTEKTLKPSFILQIKLGFGN